MEWISAIEASEITGRHKRAIYRWVKEGYVESKVVKTLPRQKRGKMVFRRDQVELCADTFYVGYRTDRFGLGEDDFVAPPAVSPKRRELVFEDWQIELARKVLA
jgi:hypothetical protein